MKKILVLFLLIGNFTTLFSEDVCCEGQNNSSFYLKVGSGISFSEPLNVRAPYPTWDRAIQGYHSKIGNRFIGDLGVGLEAFDLVDFEVSLSIRSTFKYRKFQTPASGGSSYTREFDLDVIPLLFSVNLLGKDIPYLNWECFSYKLYPVIGAGVGVSSLLITNFRTTGLAPTGSSSPFNSFSAENEYTRRNHFTYSALIGFEYSDCNKWALSTGYRFLDAGKFKGPRFFRVDTGGAVDVAKEGWKMHFRANEWFIELKIFL